MKAFTERSTVAGMRTISSDENYGLLLMTLKMNSLLLSVVNRNMYVGNKARTLRERLGRIEENVNTAEATFESVNKIAESIVENKQKHPGNSKPVSESRAVEQLKAFTGDRSKCREWNEKLLNA